MGGDWDREVAERTARAQEQQIAATLELAEALKIHAAALDRSLQALFPLIAGLSELYQGTRDGFGLELAELKEITSQIHSGLANVAAELKSGKKP